MARRAVARALVALVLLLLQRGAPLAAESLDAQLAYVLATASYCAYAVNEADADFGHARAFSCLRAAAREDPRALAPLMVRPQDVETYFAPDRPEDAYLLVRTRKDVILAFRGTAPPPILPEVAAAARRGVDLWRTFFEDLSNDFNAHANERGRHAGFDESWGRLKEHLLDACSPAARRAPCSKFRLFVGQLRDGATLYLTGHSKGGALATLAGLDAVSRAEPRATQVVYTFAAAKAVTAEAAAQAASAAHGWWRFERESDIVPSLPPDATLLLWIVLGSPYAHLGDLVYFTKDSQPFLLRAEPDMIVPPGDWARTPAFFANQAGSVVASWLSPDFVKRILNSSEAACRALVDNHFKVFADVQAFATANPAILAAGGDQSFFARGLYDRRGRQILRGFSAWCEQLKILD